MRTLPVVPVWAEPVSTFKCPLLAAAHADAMLTLPLAPPPSETPDCTATSPPAPFDD
jgi:hypothetical protein